MAISIWVSYVIACILLISPPGPTVTYLITTSMVHGKKTAYEVVWGSFFGGLVCLVLSFIGIGTILNTSIILYSLFRILGISYLLYLGIRSLLEIIKDSSVASQEIVPPKKGEGFKNGFLLIFLNPKNIIFFASFLPQFIDEQSSLYAQVIILSVTYLVIGLVNDFLYSFFASHIGKLLGQHSEKWINGIGGLAMVLSAIIVIFQNF
ncbi:LysE family translocator [Streptococcus tangpeifui]|uniref:LysE family translocator n=1 Tax=Streptococcus tangpeifui TaxID=2709400 RepID=UPI0013ECA628|nr:MULTISPECIES: LysE family translocator [unclassified Streptococcus]